MRIMVNRTKAKISVTTKEPLKKKQKMENGPPDSTIKEESAVVRKFSVVFAPHLPNNSCKYVVEREGIRGIA